MEIILSAGAIQGMVGQDLGLGGAVVCPEIRDGCMPVDSSSLGVVSQSSLATFPNGL